MAQAAYHFAELEAGEAENAPCDVLAPAVTLFAASPASAELAEACGRLGFAPRAPRPLASLVDGTGGWLGDIVLADCRTLGIAEFAALSRLDDRARRSGARVIVLTVADHVEEVFGCLSQASVQILADPRPGDLAMALARTLPGSARMRVRELDESERFSLLRLTEEIGRLSAKLDALAVPMNADTHASQTGRLASPGLGYRAEGEGELLRRPRPALPDPRLVQSIIRQRRLRDRYFESELFADPAWDILLDLTAARAEHRRVSVTSLCIAAAVPTTTALRWIQQMTDMGILVRQSDPDDRRRAFIAMSDDVADAMARYFDELGKQATRLV